MQDLQHFRVLEDCINRHWSPDSEIFTGADSLLSAQERGWKILTYAKRLYQSSSTRRTTVYVFTMERDGEYIKMAVVLNPYIKNLIKMFEENAPQSQHKIYVSSSDHQPTQ
ncbi:hypothetical protein MASR2M15_13730 [Anaerolineales bacterium]